MTASLRETVFTYCLETYGTTPDSPFPKDPLDMVLRHADTRKWYGLVFPVAKRKLRPLMNDADLRAAFGAGRDEDYDVFGGFGDSLVSMGRAAHQRAFEDRFEDDFDDEVIDVINLKCDPTVAQTLHTRPGIMPAYHMNHTQWITVLLDGTVPAEEVFPLLDMSFDLTASKAKRPANGPREWLVPSNPKFFDVIAAFEAEEEIDWKQSSAVRVGDTVYLYVGAPYSAILYRCTASTSTPATNSRSRACATCSRCARSAVRAGCPRSFPRN